ncbi:MAG: hypothetical protein MUF48_14345 [Pirellulaceae bacterium]|nr:hypothetical protein [Pirellulaceae bacterium]
MTRFLTEPGCRGVLILCCCVMLAGAGCGRAAVPQDPAPFLAAVERYLQQNNMALRIKEVEDGPEITGKRATMTVSLTHAELGGPSVVWEFDFTQQPAGNWEAVKRAP